MKNGAAIPVELENRLRSCRGAAATLKTVDRSQKDQVLKTAARLLGERSGELLSANAEDLADLAPDATQAFRDRLLLTENRIAQMRESLQQVAALGDPVGEEVDSRRLTNGLLTRRVRSPLGVILMIFEARPNVATEAFSLAFKSGNVIILRGGKESMRSTSVIYSILGEALAQNGFPADCIWGITDPDRDLTAALLKQSHWIDVVVPRGGDRLIEYVVSASRIPIIKNDRGLCHVYVHEDAALDMAERIVENAKTQRPGVCNAMETLLVHERIAAVLLPRLHAKLKSKKVRWLGCPKTLQILKGCAGVVPAAPDSFDQEHLDLILNARVINSLEEALAHIDAHGSRHSEAIITASEAIARDFQTRVDAAATYWNASTRFTDGFEFGLGGELGISTQKLHVRGPVGLRELTSVRWIIDGEGQIRE